MIEPGLHFARGSEWSEAELAIGAAGACTVRLTSRKVDRGTLNTVSTSSSLGFGRKALALGSTATTGVTVSRCCKGAMAEMGRRMKGPRGARDRGRGVGGEAGEEQGPGGDHSAQNSAQYQAQYREVRSTVQCAVQCTIHLTVQCPIHGRRQSGARESTGGCGETQGCQKGRA